VLELSENLGVIQSTEPRQDVVDLEVFSSIRRQRDHLTHSIVRHRLMTAT